MIIGLLEYLLIYIKINLYIFDDIDFSHLLTINIQILEIDFKGESSNGLNYCVSDIFWM